MSVKIDHVAIRPLDEIGERYIVYATPDGQMAFIEGIDELLPGAVVDGVMQPGAIVPVYEASIESVLEFEQWAKQNPQHFKACPKYQGVIYNKGQIEGYVLFNGDSPPYGEITENIRLPLDTHTKGILSSLQKQGYDMGPPNYVESFNFIPVEPAINVRRFEWDYNEHARDYCRGEEAGSVLVPPRVLRAVRLMEKERLTQRANPKKIFPSAGENGSAISEVGH